MGVYSAMRVLYHLTTSDLKSIPEEARWAESMGYDGLCTEETGHDPFFPLLLAAGATSRVSLETRVAIAFPRSPMVVAYTAMDLQNYSNGRFRLGLGTQVKGHIERRFSTNWISPGPRLREYIQSLRAIWRCWEKKEPLRFEGEHYRFTLMTPEFSPPPSGQPPVPISIAAVGRAMMKLAGRWCDGVRLHGFATRRYLEEVALPPRLLRIDAQLPRRALPARMGGAGTDPARAARFRLKQRSVQRKCCSRRE